MIGRTRTAAAYNQIQDVEMHSPHHLRRSLFGYSSGKISGQLNTLGSRKEVNSHQT